MTPSEIPPPVPPPVPPHERPPELPAGPPSATAPAPEPRPDSQARPAGPHHGIRLLRWLATAAALLLAAALLTLAALWSWTGSEQSLQWAWDRVAPARGLQAQALQGSLREGMRAKRLRWVLDEWEVEAEDVVIDWQPGDLPALGERRLLRLQRVQAGALRLIPRPRAGPTPPGAPAAVPTRLVLPLALQVDEVRLDRFEMPGGWQLQDLVAAYAYDRQQHRVELRQARVAQASLGTLALQGQAQLGGEAPLPLDLRLQGRWERPPAAGGTPADRTGAGSASGSPSPSPSPAAQDLDFEATARGPLALLDLQLRLGARGRPTGESQAEWTARVAPWGQPRWRAIDGRLRGLDLADWWPQAPRTRLQGSIALVPPQAGPRPGPGRAPGGSPGTTAPGSLRLDLENTLPGPRSEGRLPLAKIEAEADLGDDLLQALRLQLGLPGGASWLLRLQAPVRWQRIGMNSAGSAGGKGKAGGAGETGGTGGFTGFALGPGALLLSAPAPASASAPGATEPMRLAWRGLRWRPDRLQAQATLTGLQLAWLAGTLDLLPPGWRLRGALSADIALAGTPEQPQWSGQLRADEVSLRSVVDGVDLRGGRLRARLADRQLFIDELQLLGQDEAGRPGSGGRLQAQGEGRWPEGGDWALALDASVFALRASLRPDRRLTVSGQAHAEMASGRPRPPLQLQAGLRVDQARITLPEHAAPRLGTDVVVRGLPPGVQLEGLAASGAGSPAGSGALPLQLQVRIDLGPDFVVAGHGLQAQAKGRLAASGASFTDLRLAGSVDMAGGHYQAFGQRLQLARGLLRFNGPPLDPALDLLALRPVPPGETQRVGVQVSGSAQSPRVRLWSEPALAEAQALSWLALGRASATGGSETALLEDLAVSMLTRRAGLGSGGGGGLAQRLGLDELALRRDSASGASGGTSTAGASAAAGGTGTGAQGATLAVGKRLTQDLYAVYERGLSGVLGTFRVFYDISRRLQLRFEAGDRSGVDLVYTVTRD